jgi:hypothetical protein
MKLASRLIVPAGLLVLFGGSPSYACSQGSTYCERGYLYECVCWTGQGCRWMYMARCHHDDPSDPQAYDNRLRLKLGISLLQTSNACNVSQTGSAPIRTDCPR